jgi:hypothetical protein
MKALTSAAVGVATYLFPGWEWLLHLLWWAAALSAGTAVTTVVAFFVVRWLKRRFPDNGEQFDRKTAP